MLLIRQMLWVFQPEIAAVFQVWTIFLFFMSDLINGVIDDFHNMKPIKGDLCRLKGLLNPPNEGQRHVAADFFYFTAFAPWVMRSSSNAETVVLSLPEVAKMTLDCSISTKVVI